AVGRRTGEAVSSLLRRGTEACWNVGTVDAGAEEIGADGVIRRCCEEERACDGIERNGSHDVGGEVGQEFWLRLRCELDGIGVAPAVALAEPEKSRWGGVGLPG